MSGDARISEYYATAHNDPFLAQLAQHWLALADDTVSLVERGDATALLRALLLACAVTTGDLASLSVARARLQHFGGNGSAGLIQ